MWCVVWLAGAWRGVDKKHQCVIYDGVPLCVNSSSLSKLTLAKQQPDINMRVPTVMIYSRD